MPENTFPAVRLYAHIPGMTTLSRNRLATLWRRLVAEQIAPRLFYDGGVRSEEAFIQFMTAQDVYCYAAYVRGNPVALTWLNNFSGRAAMIHFAIFSAGLSFKTEVGRHVVHFLLHARHEGEYCLDTLYGLTPKPYAHVLRFIRRVGFRVQGEVPSAVPLRVRGPEGMSFTRHVGGVLSVCTRESFGGLGMTK